MLLLLMVVVPLTTDVLPHPPSQQQRCVTPHLLLADDDRWLLLLSPSLYYLMMHVYLMQYRLVLVIPLVICCGGRWLTGGSAGPHTHLAWRKRDSFVACSQGADISSEPKVASNTVTHMRPDATELMTRSRPLTRHDTRAMISDSTHPPNQYLLD